MSIRQSHNAYFFILGPYYSEALSPCLSQFYNVDRWLLPKHIPSFNSLVAYSMSVFNGL